MIIFKCVLCGSFSLDVICLKCQSDFLKPTVFYKNGRLSFYEYDSIKELIKYKYHRFGHRIFKILAANSLAKFSETFTQNAYLIPIDDRIKNGYSHTAVLANTMKSKTLKPLFSTLHSQSDFKYAGKPLAERLKHPRNFIYKGPKNIDAVLVDDITTTGLTLNEAKKTLAQYGVNVVLSIFLADLTK